MNDLRKVLVVDTGRRGVVDSLSAELAELGFSSVTASVEAADEVLELIERPSAIFLNLQNGADVDRQGFLDLATRLQGTGRTRDIPVIVWDELHCDGAGVSDVLARQFGPQVLAGPDI